MVNCDILNVSHQFSRTMSLKNHINYIFIVLFLTVACAFPVDDYEGDKYEGDVCQLNAFHEGVCRKVSKCPPALKMIKKTGQHSLNRCGFEGFTEIVCCPLTYNERLGTESTTTTTTTTTTISPDEDDGTASEVSTQTSGTGRKSKIACDELSNEIPVALNFHILGGQQAKLGEFPHMGALGYDYSGQLRFECAGTLITNQYVLTAGHCVNRADDKLPITVRFGKIDLQGNTDNVENQDYTVENVIPHPEYRSLLHYHDLALLKLSSTVTYSKNVHPACLYQKPDNPKGLVATGWGATENADFSPNLLKVSLSAVDLPACNASYNRRSDKRLPQGLMDSQFCAIGIQDVTDACQGDSGGPLQILEINTPNVWSIVGVISFGVGCATTIPGVYVRVNSYLDWIESVVWP